MMDNKSIAAIRTAFAGFGVTVIGVFVSWLANKGVEIDVDPTWGVVLGGFLFSLAIGIYNYVVAFLTEKVDPRFNRLLLIDTSPKYEE